MSQSQALWTLEQGQALRMEIGPGERVLEVSEGRVWLTKSGAAAQPATDIWLAAGESMSLPAGTEVVVEAWPQAQFQLLVPPSACRRIQTRERGLPRWMPQALVAA